MSETTAVKTMADLDFAGKRALVRVDFNVPLDEEGRITDPTRIERTLPTVDYLRQKGAKIILMSHLGRPKGQVNPKYSLKPVYGFLQGVYGKDVFFAPDCIGGEARTIAAALKEGQILLLENLRFYPEEEKNDPVFAQKLAALAQIYVDDAFGTAHRAHASTAGVADYLPGCVGLLMGREIEMLDVLFADPQRPFVAVIGGAKVSDKIAVIENLLAKVDKLLIGGGMGNTFLAAQGYDMQASLCETDKLDWAGQLLARPDAKKLFLPVDLVAASKPETGVKTAIVAPDALPAGWQALDIGPETIKAFAAVIAKAGTVVWNGPMGVFEIDEFAQGTLELAQAVAASPAFSIVGGGDSVAAVQKAGLEDQIGHISTGGGATLKYLEGKALPAIIALTR